MSVPPPPPPDLPCLSCCLRLRWPASESDWRPISLILRLLLMDWCRTPASRPSTQTVSRVRGLEAFDLLGIEAMGSCAESGTEEPCAE